MSSAEFVLALAFACLGYMVKTIREWSDERTKRRAWKQWRLEPPEGSQLEDVKKEALKAMGVELKICRLLDEMGYSWDEWPGAEAEAEPEPEPKPEQVTRPVWVAKYDEPEPKPLGLTYKQWIKEWEKEDSEPEPDTPKWTCVECGAVHAKSMYEAQAERAGNCHRCRPDIWAWDGMTSTWYWVDKPLKKARDQDGEFSGETLDKSLGSALRRLCKKTGEFSDETLDESLGSVGKPLKPTL